MKSPLLVLTALVSAGALAAEPETAPEAPAAAKPAELIATRCLICHGNPAAGTRRLAPPFRMVKMHYDDLDEAAFIQAVSAWVKQPDKKNSRMPGAVRNFGLMPPQVVTDEEITAIARYLYTTDFQMPGRGMCGGPETKPAAEEGKETGCGSTCGAAGACNAESHANCGAKTSSTDGKPTAAATPSCHGDSGRKTAAPDSCETTEAGDSSHNHE